MTDDRLDRLEAKIDLIAADVMTVKLAAAELKGERKATLAIAAAAGSLTGFLATFFRGHAP